MAKIGINQVKILMKLGYVETEEDGAIAEHPRMYGNAFDKYIWEDESMDDVLSKYEDRIRNSQTKKILNTIISNNI